MRVGLLTTSYPRHEGDLAGLFVQGFARSLARRGHRLEVIAPEPASPGDCPRWEDGIDLRWARYSRPRGLGRTFYGAGVPDNLRASLWAWPGLLTYPLALYAAARPRVRSWDALVSHWALPSALIAGAIRGDRPHLAVLHSADVHALRRLPGGDRLAARIVHGATSLLFVSPALRDLFFERLPRPLRALAAARTHVCPMGIDEPDAPRPAADREAARARFALRRFSVLSMGRLVPIKGIEDAIAALSPAASAPPEGVPPLELLVAGEGPERARLMQLAARRRAPVRFLGTVSGGAKAALLQAADAFVLPSRSLASGRTEGTPTALLEAMLSGLPIVATAVGGVPSVLHDGRTGLLVPERSPARIADALSSLRGDPALRARLASGARGVGTRFRWPMLAPAYEALLMGERAEFPSAVCS
ncbi:MAG: glycosyltransferase family 4 protein [Myxococcales bacterium]|nr:glycosyltransferase family 4 protein [Myxococcales bacterium]